MVTYTPTANFNGYDNFYFTVSDGEATSETSTVHITLTAVNDAPTASVLSASGSEDETQTIALVGSDVDSDYLTYVLVNNPAHGTVTVLSNMCIEEISPVVCVFFKSWPQLQCIGLVVYTLTVIVICVFVSVS